MKKELSIQEILDKANEQTKKFIKDLENEEKNLERVETINVVENEIKAIRNNTELKKKQFINELKSGLGDRLKKNPNQIIVKKETLLQRIAKKLKNLFTKF